MASPSDLPAPLKGIDKGFTHDSIAARLPKIWQEMIQNNHFSEGQIQQLHQMMDEMRNGAQLAEIEGLDRYIQGLDRQSSEYAEAMQWKDRIKDYVSNGATWWDAPWLFVEIYAYRRALQILNYFDNLKDPFEASKQRGLNSSWDKIVKFVLGSITQTLSQFATFKRTI